MKINLQKRKNEIITICHLMHQKGFLAATDGNVSSKVDEDTILITPSGFNKAFISKNDLILINFSGKVLDGKYLPSSEYKMHIEAYTQRTDIEAVVHAHPPHITAFSITDQPFPNKILPEVILTMGDIPKTEYANPGTQKAALAIRELIKNHNAIILNHHGSFTVGKDLMAAYNLLEKMEHAAHTISSAKQLGNIERIPNEDLKELYSRPRNNEKSALEK